MRRLVLMCLLGLGATACTPEEPPPDVEPQEQPLCPELVVQDKSLVSPVEGLGSASSALGTLGTERVLVRFRPQSGVYAAALSRDREARVRSLGAEVRYNWPSLNALAVALTPAMRTRLAQDPEVLSITPDKEVHALGTSAWVPVSALLAAPNPTGSTSEYTWAVKMTQADKVWDPDGQGVLKAGAPTGEGITVCVIDSGIDPDHPEFQGTYAGGHDFIDKDDVPADRTESGVWGGGHGTHVAGTIAAQMGFHGQVNPNDKTLSAGGMVGVAPGVKLLVARVLDTKGSGSTSDVMEALKWCQEHGAHIASMSLGSSASDPVEDELFKQMWGKGMLSIAASGNSGETLPEAKVYPAAYDTVLAVGAVDAKMEHPAFSQGGEHLSVVGPGVGVYSTFPRGKASYATLSAEGVSYDSSALEFANQDEYEGKLLDCGLGQGLRSCPESTCSGFVAYVDRGDIHFSDKVKNVRSQGARAVIIGNNKPKEDEGLAFTLESAATWPPVTAVPSTLVPTMRSLFGHTVRVGVRGADYAYSTGTSMATPHVAGVAALVWSSSPHLTNEQVRRILERSAKRLADPARADTAADFDKVFGWGLVQAKDAVDLALKEYARKP